MQVPGRTLQDLLDGTGPLELADIIRIGVQLAHGLAAAHELGLIHRDIKPANILLEGGVDLRVKITDFGLARAADDASMTASGVVTGTPLYMAPEQARGDHLDHRADLFSLGSVLYTMCSGHPPFRANSTLAVLKRVCDDTPRPISEIIPETPRWLCDIIAKLLAKNLDERFQTAREVADLLAKYAVEPPPPEPKSELKAKAVAAADEVRPRSGRNLVLLASLLFLAVAVGIGLHLATKGDKPADPIAKKDEEAPKKNETPIAVVADTERKAAEYVLSIGGDVRVNDKDTDIRTVSELPRRAFRLTYVNLFDNRRVEDLSWLKDVKLTYLNCAWTQVSDLSPLKNMQLRELHCHDTEISDLSSLRNMKLRDLHCHGTQVTDADLTVLQEMSSLRVLRIGGPKITDAGLAHLKKLTELEQLTIHGTKLTGTGLRHLGGMTTLQELRLHNPELTDEGLVHLKGLLGLRILELHETRVTDAGLEHLTGLVNLKHLKINQTKVTDEGVARLKAALPKCDITFDAKADTERKAAEYVLSIGGDVRVNEQNVAIKEIAALPPGSIRLNWVGFIGNPRATNEAVATLHGCKHLHHLDLGSTKITDDAFAAFPPLADLDYLSLGGNPIGDTTLAHLGACTKLRGLYLGATQVTDAGLQHLQSLATLRSLNLTQTKVTKAGVEKLAAALPGCKIDWGGGIIQPKAK